MNNTAYAVYERRAKMLAGVDRFINTTSVLKSTPGQKTIFDIGSNTNIFTDESILNNITVNTNAVKEVMRAEKEVLGVYLTFHPLDGCREKILKYSNVASNEISELSEGESVTMGGVIVRIDQKTTRSNRPIMFVTLEDFRGTAECIVFDKEIGKYRKLLKEDAVVFIRGTISVRTMIPNIIVNEIVDEKQIGVM